MRQGWRWYGPEAYVTLDDVRQAGATDIVSALHQVPIGEAWTEAAVAARKNLVETTPAGRTPLVWSCVESIPVPDAVKRKGGAAKPEIDAWIASLEAVAACDIRTVCYNFMPIVDWTRTDMDHPMPTGATAMRFDQDRFAAFDLHILERSGAEGDYSEADRTRARLAFERDVGRRARCAHAQYREWPAGLDLRTADDPGLPGEARGLSRHRRRAAPPAPRRIPEAVTPAAEARGVTLTLHPDDPPRALFGLPRIASTAEDYAALFDAVPSPANGCASARGRSASARTTTCRRSPGASPPASAFVHLRRRSARADPRSFYESDHLDGDVDMVAVLQALVAEDRTRHPRANCCSGPTMATA